MFESVEEVEQIETEPKCEEAKQVPKMPNGALQNDTSSPDSGHPSSRNFSVTSGLSDGSLSTEDSAAPQATTRSAAVTQSFNEPSEVNNGSMAENGPEEHEVQEEVPAAAVVTNAAEKTTAEVKGSIQPLEEEAEGKSKINEPPEAFVATQTRKTDELKTCKPEGLSLTGEMEKQPLHHLAREKDVAQDVTESDESPSAIEMEEIPKAKVSMVPWGRKGYCEATSQSDVEQGKRSAAATQSVFAEEPNTEGRYTNSISKSKAEDPSGQSAGFSVGTLNQIDLNQFSLNWVFFYVPCGIYLFLFSLSARTFRPVHLESAPYR